MRMSSGNGMPTLDRLSVRNMLARLVKFSSGKGGGIVSSILDRCAEIEAEEAFVDGGWYPMESDGLEYCTGCGKPLSCSPHECVQIFCEYGKVRDWYDLFAVICATNSEGLENLPNCRVLKLPPMMRHIARRVEKSWKKRQRSACRSCAFYRVQGGRFSCVRFRSWGDSTSPEKSACCNFRRRKCYAD